MSKEEKESIKRIEAMLVSMMDADDKSKEVDEIYEAIGGGGIKPPRPPKFD